MDAAAGPGDLSVNATRVAVGLLLSGALVTTFGGTQVRVQDSSSTPSVSPTVEAATAPAAEADPCVPEPTLEQLVGQKLMVTMGGLKPTRALLRRVRNGEIGGVVLLGRNVDSPAQTRRLTRRLQRAAAEGSQPPLLISIDQEGGSVKRVTWAPPTLTVPAIGATGSTRIARKQGALTGAALRSLGINVNLAPVADVPRSRASFMLQQGRTFSFDAATTDRLANAFAAGLGSEGVFATMKHFPGIGRASRNTDKLVETIRAGRQALRSDLRPYRQAIRRDVPLIMLSNATFPAFDGRNAAGWSRAIATDLLRDELGYTGVSVTDSLNGTANARGTTVRKLAFKAARAGADIILTTGNERSTTWLHGRLLSDAQKGRIPRETLEASYERILALKERLPQQGRARSSTHITDACPTNDEDPVAPSSAASPGPPLAAEPSAPPIEPQEATG
jgi:beta-N-acetylhexosaminidase